MALLVKEGVILPTPLKATTARIMDVVAETYTAFGFTVRLTSGIDGKHMSGSKHYSGDALDFGIKYGAANIETTKLRDMVRSIRSRLGVDYDVVIEPDHLHVEYDPK